MSEFVLGVDGGNSKTDLVIATADGELLANVRGAGTRSHVDGIPATARDLADLVARGRTAAGLAPRTPIALGAFHLANVDLPEAERAAQHELAALGVTERVVVRNDTFAVLRAGAPAGWGVAVVSGAGINALGVAPDGTEARFLSLGPITGDWGGGQAVGLAGLGAAVRATDGRGDPTVLVEVVARHFGTAGPGDVAVAIEAGALSVLRLHELAPLVVAAAEAGDAVAAGIVDRLAAEVVTMTVALLRRLRLLDVAAPVVLGGGTLQAEPGRLLAGIHAGLAERAPLAVARVLNVPPVAGALLDALDGIGAGDAARAHARDAFAALAGPVPSPAG